MSDEQKKPKATLIKHKKPIPSAETKGKDEPEKKKIVVVKKKKVVVKKAAVKTTKPEITKAAPTVERVRLQDRPTTQDRRPAPAARDRKPIPSRDRPPSRIFKPRETEADSRRPPRTSRRPGAPAPTKPTPAAQKEEAAKPAGKKFFKSKKKDAFAKAREKFEEHQEKIFAQAKKKTMQRANPVPREISIMENVTVSELARKMNLKAADLISKLMSMGMMVTMNEQIDSETASILAQEYDCKVNVVSLYDETIIEKEEDREEDMASRPPIVTVMGHVDHGKTKLLDAIRATNVVDTEFGGITQHIGAYSVELEQGKIVFLDTPGHEAFTTMRARGAQVTDIVVLVVAADDGVMPQTEEAVSHAKEAKVPIIVAINKIDLPDANPDRVKQQLSERDLVPEDWGGNTQYVQLSALKRTGIKELLDAILLQAEILELNANYICRAEGKIVESKIDFGRGNVATVLIQRGTLKVGDPFVAGVFSGKVRAMFNDKGDKVEEATPSIPVEILGFSGIPNAGDPFQVTESEKEARQIGDKRQELRRLEDARNVRKITLDNIYEQIKEGEVLELKVIIKGDVHGSVEALEHTLERLSTPEIRLNVIHASAGAINERDVMLASASNAIIVGFNVRPTPSTQSLADQEKVEIRKYNVIYEVVDDIKAAMEGLLAPEISERTIGTAEVRNLFKVPKIGVVAGCYVTSGKIRRNATAKVVRDGKEVYAGKVSSLKRFKDDAREVEEGYECGIGIENFNDIKAGDIIEALEQVELAKTLESVSSDGGSKAEEG
ncbi:MAG: translation initiation factor IF-2 [Spirochaetaceae bacterium]|nr:MAG: translation initiation factor IF-2 [Spirochaetaceae bacterium]